MNIADPHRGRKFQFDELEGALWMDNIDCELNATLLHHLENIGWKVNSVTFSSQ